MPISVQPNTLTKQVIDGKTCMVAVSELFDEALLTSGTSKKGNDYKLLKLCEGFYEQGEFGGHEGVWNINFSITRFPQEVQTF
jgi:hypothetical protein